MSIRNLVIIEKKMAKLKKIAQDYRSWKIKLIDLSIIIKAHIFMQYLYLACTVIAQCVG